MSQKNMIDMSAKKGYQICQINIITTFFYRFLNEKIYIMQLTIFEEGITCVYFFKKVLYGVKQVLQVYYQTFVNLIKKLDFYKTETDYS